MVEKAQRRHYRLEGRRFLPQCITVTGPLGEKVQAKYTIFGTGEDKTAILEMAQAAGLTLVPVSQRNPLKTTTYGVGEM